MLAHTVRAVAHAVKGYSYGVNRGKACSMARVPSSPYDRLKSDWLAVLQRLMEQRRLTMRGLSLAAGANETLVREWIKKGKAPSFASIAQVAKVLEVSVDTFLEPNDKINDTAPLAPASSGVVPLIGVLQAGNWQEPEMIDLEPAEAIPFIPDPNYHGLRQVAWRVSGPSMNRIANHGEYVIGVSLIDLGRRPDENAAVVCERRDGHRHEYTVKRIHYRRGGYELAPDSTDSRFQAPIWVSDQEHEGNEVEMTHLVIGVYKKV